MPSGGATALIGFGAVLTSVSATAGSIVAGIGILWEGYLFYRLGASE
jgi:hypothetical protein